uniref:Ionotropic Receptor n=1 Tax=Epiphyas postvittana TaxID=65032 RepID=A0A0K8TUX1_EPIPO
MAGMELIISSFCNATFCDVIYDSPSPLTEHQAEVIATKNELNGKHLKVATYDNYPLSWVATTENSTLNGRGVAFVIFDILREQFNFTFDVITPSQNFEIGGSEPEQSLIGLVNSTKVDMAVAFVPILYKYQSMVDFSSILDEGVWNMMLRRPKESAAGSGLLAPFEVHVWYLILAAVLSYGPCITFLTYVRSKMVKDDESHIPLSPSFWFVYGAFIKQGTTLAPEANTTRVLFTTWWLFIILLSAFYTANLTAFLTLSKFTLDIENPQDILKKNYRWVAPQGSTVQYTVGDVDSDLYYLNKMVANGRAQFPSVNADKQFLPLVAGGAVLVKEQTAIDHLMFADYVRKTKDGVAEADRCTYVVAPHPFMEKLRGFAFPRGSKLKPLFDPVLTYLLQSGIVKFLEHRDLPSTKICPLDLQSKDRKLRNSDLTMTYMIMVTGLAAAIGVFVGEMMIRRYVRVKMKNMRGDTKTKLPKNAAMTRRFKLDDSRPPPYDSLFGNNSRYKMTGKSKRKIINGREYWVVGTVNGESRLIPVRTPSAFLYQRDK